MRKMMTAAALAAALTGCVSVKITTTAYTANLEPAAIEDAASLGLVVTLAKTIEYGEETRVVTDYLNGRVHPNGFRNGGAFAFAIQNNSDKLLVIDWDRSSLVDERKRARRIIHAGTRLLVRNEVQAPTSVPPGARLEEFIMPADAFENRSGNGWVQTYWLPTAEGKVDKELRLVLSYTLDGVAGTLIQRVRLVSVDVKQTATGEQFL
jgi:hypothetical protein